MTIFNSYVKLPEGISGVDIIEIHEIRYPGWWAKKNADTFRWPRNAGFTMAR